jgi:hypothetical protein
LVEVVAVAAKVFLFRIRYISLHLKILDTYSYHYYKRKKVSFLIATQVFLKRTYLAVEKPPYEPLPSCDYHHILFLDDTHLTVHLRNSISTKCERYSVSLSIPNYYSF